MKTIAIINMKGGCAKTTTSVNMGYILAEDYDKKVLIIDNDKQGNLSKACGVWNDEAPSFADVLTGDKTLTDVMQLGANGNIAVAPANMSLLTANLEVIKNEEIDQVTILSKELEKVKDTKQSQVFQIGASYLPPWYGNILVDVQIRLYMD